MQLRHTIKHIGIISLLVQMASCHVTQKVPGEALELDKRDRIVTIVKAGDPELQIPVIMKGMRFNGAYIYEDTLIIKVNTGKRSDPNTKELRILMSELKYADIRRYSKEATTAAVASGSAVVLGVGIWMVIVLGLAIVAVFASLFALIGI
jgi:hypothetical protein